MRIILENVLKLITAFPFFLIFPLLTEHLFYNEISGDSKSCDTTKYFLGFSTSSIHYPSLVI